MNSAVEFIFNKNFVEKKKICRFYKQCMGPIGKTRCLLKHASKKKKQNKTKRRKTHTLGTE